jgi:hypothetical protein
MQLLVLLTLHGTHIHSSNIPLRWTTDPTNRNPGIKKTIACQAAKRRGQKHSAAGPMTVFFIQFLIKLSDINV